MTKIFLIRHAEAEGNLYRRCHGHYDSLITANGYLQIAALRERFAETAVDAVWSSDLFRTRTTAEAIYLPKRLELYTTPELREIGCGSWEDISWGDLDRMDHESLQRFTSCDEGWKTEGSETFPVVRERMDRCLRRLAAQYDGGTIAVFSHGMAIRTIVSTYLGLPISGIPHCDNTAVTTLLFDGDRVTVAARGDASHLTAEISTFAHQAWWREKQGGAADVQLGFVPIDFEKESGLYEQFRREAWITIHGSMEHYDGIRFLTDAKQHAAYAENSVLKAMLGDQIAGLIQMDFVKDAECGIGCIPFCYLTPEFRARGLGVQLLGQAVSTYRAMGRTKLRLRCAPDNYAAQYFYKKYGFVRVGAAENSAVPLDLLDMEIGKPGQRDGETMV